MNDVKKFKSLVWGEDCLMTFWIFNKFMSNIQICDIQRSLIMDFIAVVSVTFTPGPHEK
jgi:hypothetical protein